MFFMCPRCARTVYSVISRTAATCLQKNYRRLNRRSGARAVVFCIRDYVMAPPNMKLYIYFFLPHRPDR